MRLRALLHRPHQARHAQHAVQQPFFLRSGVSLSSVVLLGRHHVPSDPDAHGQHELFLPDVITRTLLPSWFVPQSMLSKLLPLLLKLF
jgi:hypothetical protein